MALKAVANPSGQTILNGLVASGDVLNTSLDEFAALNLPRFRKAIANVRAGKGNARILCMGNSQTEGSYAAVQNTNNSTSNYLYAWPAHLSRMLSASGVNSHFNSFFGAASTTERRDQNDARLTVSGGFASPSVQGTCGGYYYSTSTAGSLNFAPTENVDTFVIVYGVGAGLGTFSYGVDGGSTTNQATAGTAAQSTVTITAPLGRHTVNINWVSGNIFIVGVYAYDSSKSWVEVDNAGWSGSTTSSSNWGYTATPSSTLNSCVNLAPDLAIIELGQNDIILSSTPVATISANLQTIITALTATTDIIIVDQIPLPTSSISQATQDQLSAALKALVAANPNVSLANVYDRWVSYTYSNALGYYGTGSTNATLHPYGPGYADYALTIFNSIANAIGAGTISVSSPGIGRVVAQTAAVSSVAALTVGASDATFMVSANVLVTAATTANFTVTCAYTDEGNTSRTLTLTFSQLAGTLLTAITNVTGTGPYEGVPLHIRCKAATTITIATTGTFTSVTYNAEGLIRQMP